MAISSTNFERSKILKLPESPGVYLFKTDSNKIIYIGKAKNLKRRVYSYKSKNVEGKIKNIRTETNKLSYYLVSSELEALLLEAKLVRKYKPRYNSDLKDDKNPLYIQITKDKYPIVMTARKNSPKNYKNIYGPFPRSNNAKSVIYMLRKIFPYAHHVPGKKPCIYSQIGLCKPCPTTIEKEKDTAIKSGLTKIYKKNIRAIKTILDGKFSIVRNSLVSEMETLAKDENYEEASMLRDQIYMLDYITQPITPIDFYLENPNLLEDIRTKEAEELRNILLGFMGIDDITRIECYDIAHLSGESPTASMVTFVNGEADKSLYRQFKINQKSTRSDTDSLKEVVTRRSKHFHTWGKPNLIVVDGGKAQVAVFVDVLRNFNIPIVGIAKRYETLVIPVNTNSKKYVQVRLKPGYAKNLVQRLRNEAHRFARRYHHKLVKRTYFKD